MAPGAVIEQQPASSSCIESATSKSNCVSTPSSTELSNAVAAAIARYTTRNPISFKLHQQATQSLPGGNTRTLLHTSPFPVYMKSGNGYQVTSEDGHTYTDFVGELTAGLYGHSRPEIRSSIVSTIDNLGLNLGATTTQEAKYAALLCERFNLERIRFTNSGTEANLHALAGARKYTGKRKVVVFKGGYHGAVLSFGSGIAENNVDREDFVVARYNDVLGAKKVIEETADLAAVLLEGMQGSGGCIPGMKEFLIAVQEAASKAGAVFILDEVMTSRLAPGGLQSMLGLKPDLTTFGKYLGGGLAFGAFGGRADIMSVYDPRLQHSLTHSGTFNNNTLAMHAGYAGIAQVYTPGVVTAFTESGDQFREKLQQVTKGTKCSVTGLGTLMAVHFSPTGRNHIGCNEDIAEIDELKDLFWLEMMEAGFWITRRGMIAMILDTPQEELDRFVDSVEQFLKKHENLIALDEL